MEQSKMESLPRITPEDIQELLPNEIFVFGDNTLGFHGAGAAKIAMQKFGAVWGKKFLQGQSYGIPTKDNRFKTLPLHEIEKHVQQFIINAQVWKDKHFLVTAIGCGLAHLTPEEIAPMFKECLTMTNVSLPISFINVLNQTQ